MQIIPPTGLGLNYTYAMIVFYVKSGQDSPFTSSISNAPLNKWLSQRYTDSNGQNLENRIDQVLLPNLSIYLFESIQPISLPSLKLHN